MPWRREWQCTPVFLPGEFRGQRSLAGYSPWACKESDRTERLITLLEYFLCAKHFAKCFVSISLICLYGGHCFLFHFTGENTEQMYWVTCPKLQGWMCSRQSGSRVLRYNLIEKERRQISVFVSLYSFGSDVKHRDDINLLLTGLAVRGLVFLWEKSQLQTQNFLSLFNWSCGLRIFNPETKYHDIFKFAKLINKVYETKWEQMVGCKKTSPLPATLVFVVQSLSCVWLFVTPQTVAHQAPLSSTVSWSLLKSMSIEI